MKRWVLVTAALAIAALAAAPPAAHAQAKDTLVVALVSHPPTLDPHMHFERVGILGNIELIGANAWYVQGAQHLVKAQKDDGHWNSGTELEPADVLDSCFALLFLKKATMPVGVTLTR